MIQSSNLLLFDSKECIKLFIDNKDINNTRFTKYAFLLNLNIFFNHFLILYVQ